MPEMIVTRSARVRRSFHEQAELCARFGSAFTARLILAIEHALDERTETGRRALGWTGPPEGRGDALALRLAGGFHALVLNGSSPALAACYPHGAATDAGDDAPDDNAFLDAAVAQALVAHDAELQRWLDLPPQTHEVGRAAVLYLGLMAVVKATGLPIRLFEVGASAGPNLLLDHYCHDLGGVQCGDSNSRLKLAPVWTGQPPDALNAPVLIEQRGCDLAPVDVRRVEDRLRLRAYVWPDQPDRQRQLALALDIARASPPPIDRADAGAWVRQNITHDRPAGSATVLMHSLAYCYFPAEVQAQISDHMEQLGSRAEAQAPLAWLAYELNRANETELTLRLWPGSCKPEKPFRAGRKRTLAKVHPHGRWIVANSESEMSS